MMLPITYDEGPGYLLAEVRGQWDEKDAEQTIDAIRDEAIQRSQTRILLDVCGLVPPRSRMMLFFAGEYIAKVLGHPFKLAALATRELYEDGFAETVAVNRGASILTFFEKEEALEWLLKGSDTAHSADAKSSAAD